MLKLFAWALISRPPSLCKLQCTNSMSNSAGVSSTDWALDSLKWMLFYNCYYDTAFFLTVRYACCWDWSWGCYLAWRACGSFTRGCGRYCGVTSIEDCSDIIAVHLTVDDIVLIPSSIPQHKAAKILLALQILCKGNISIVFTEYRPTLLSIRHSKTLVHPHIQY